jgi:hypothetical protein
VPTKILYTSSGVKWGYEILPEEKPLQWFKLLLLEPKDLPPNVHDSHHMKEARSRLQSARKEASTVVGDYLRQLWKYTISEMIKEKGASAVDGQPFRVVITIPAIWPS